MKKTSSACSISPAGLAPSTDASESESAFNGEIVFAAWILEQCMDAEFRYQTRLFCSVFAESLVSRAPENSNHASVELGTTSLLALSLQTRK